MNEKKLHIGKLVESAFNQSTMSKSAFSKAIGIHNQNLNREFEKEDWSVLRLIEAGKVLHYDFSPLFKLDIVEKQKSKVLLQIEIEDEKVNDVLKVIQDKQLYNLLKK